MDAILNEVIAWVMVIITVGGWISVMNLRKFTLRTAAIFMMLITSAAFVAYDVNHDIPDILSWLLYDLWLRLGLYLAAAISIIWDIWVEIRKGKNDDNP